MEVNKNLCYFHTWLNYNDPLFGQICFGFIDDIRRHKMQIKQKLQSTSGLTVHYGNIKYNWLATKTVNNFFKAALDIKLGL